MRYFEKNFKWAMPKKLLASLHHWPNPCQITTDSTFKYHAYSPFFVFLEHILHISDTKMLYTYQVFFLNIY